MVTAVVAAGGTGKRLGGKVHKQFLRLAGKPMIAWTLRALEACRAVDAVVLVSHPDDFARMRALIRAHRIRKVSAIVPGGPTRAHSVYEGIRAAPARTRWIAVHDAARPLVTARIFGQTLAAARRHRAAVAAVPVVPTVKLADGAWVSRTLDRSKLWAIQTPQIFEAGLIRRAYELGLRKGKTATDDAAMVEAAGGRVRLVMASHRNIKVTTPEDMLIAEAFLKHRNGDR